MSSRAGLPSPPSLRRRAREHSCRVSPGVARNRDFRRRPSCFSGHYFSHHLHVAGFAAKQAAIEAGSDASPAKIAVKEWDVPTPNSHPHDPALAPDSALWYAGQESNTLGRLDPVTGNVLKTPDSGPHGLVADHAGNIWFTADFKSYIGRLDPRTG
jgi:streptogramin lyase